MTTRGNNLLKGAYILAAIGAASYLWRYNYVSLDTIIVGVVGALVLYGDGIQAEKIDGLHWRIADLARRVGHPAQEGVITPEKE